MTSGQILAFGNPEALKRGLPEHLSYLVGIFKTDLLELTSPYPLMDGAQFGLKQVAGGAEALASTLLPLATGIGSRGAEHSL